MHHQSRRTWRAVAGILSAAVLSVSLLPLSDAVAADATVDATYSDPLAPVVVHSAPTADNATVTAEGLPPGLTLVRDESADPVVWRLTGTPTAAPGIYQVTVRIGEATTSYDVVVAPEDAAVAYTGPAAVVASGTTPVKLTATVTQDDTPGDPTKAKVTFTDTTPGTGKVLCADTPVSAAGVATCEVPAAKASYSLGLTLGGSYAGASTAAVPVAVQVAPETTILEGPAEGSILTTTKTTIGYASSDPAATFVCTMDGKARPCPGTSLAFKNLGKRSHVFTVAAVSPDGATDPTPATRAFTVPVDDTGLRASSGWKRAGAAKAYLGTFLKTTKRGAELSKRVTNATGLKLVARTEKKAGSIKVLLNGTKVGSVSLVKGGKWRVLDIPGLPATFSGNIRLVSESNLPVKIDGLAVIKQQ